MINRYCMKEFIRIVDIVLYRKIDNKKAALESVFPQTILQTVFNTDDEYALRRNIFQFFFSATDDDIDDILCVLQLAFTIAVFFSLS